jgi:NOL1/NOP2/fmu family ribosome biogenesis protein
MENLKVLNSKERKKVFALIEEQYGCDFGENFEFFINSRNKIFIMSKSFGEIDVSLLRVNSLGMYLGELYQNVLRLSIEGSQAIGKIAKKNILELDDIQAERWMKGEDFEVDTDINGFVLIKNNNDFLGCGKVAGKKLYNYVPKERRT